MKISRPMITTNNNALTRYTVKVISEHFKIPTLYYEVDENYKDMISPASDAALVGLLLPAMFYGEDIYIEGDISEKLYFNLFYRFQKLLQTMMPSLHIVNIFSKSLISGTSDIHTRECAAGFSGGIDSFTTLADHFYDLPYPKVMKLTMLTYNNVGSHGSGDKAYELFTRRYNKLKPAVEKMGLPFVKINSNLDEFYTQKKLIFEETATIRNASVALLLQNGIRTFLHSSSYQYKFLSFSTIDELSPAEPLILQMLSTENIALDSVGSEYTRVEKISKVSNLEDSYTYLDVCTRDNKDKTNCSACWKCLGVLIQLEVEDNLHLYDKVFDLKIYKKNRSKILGRVLAIHKFGAASNALLAFLKKKNFSFPPASYLYYIYYKLKYLLKKIRSSLPNTQ